VSGVQRDATQMFRTSYGQLTHDYAHVQVAVHACASAGALSSAVDAVYWLHDFENTQQNHRKTLRDNREGGNEKACDASKYCKRLKLQSNVQRQSNSKFSNKKIYKKQSKQKRKKKGHAIAEREQQTEIWNGPQLVGIPVNG
jgi:hypothetical protein